MCEDLAAAWRRWREQTPYHREEDFIFASPTLGGKQPLWGQTLNADFVQPAAMGLWWRKGGALWLASLPPQPEHVGR